MSSKKVILFIVEGITDKVSFSLILERLLCNYKVLFAEVGNDITTEWGCYPNTILDKLGEFLKKTIKYYQDNYNIKRKEYFEVVHLIDLDGAYISDDRVIEGLSDHAIYKEDSIVIDKTQKICSRNKHKLAVINRLIGVNQIYQIPYTLYFFSSNLEHVLHDNANVPDPEKYKLAQIFEDRYEDCPSTFIEFLENLSCEKSDYESSWEYIKQGTNSLKRYTNLNLYFSNPRFLRS